ncbi:hypothetical protein GH714_012231 [Hevea brasiliensis]|uniref:Reverse transcriptase Ty1/copia-type domain-containing protein n=1 Tax=Hevea brasiliensis TaxID=3981 RepID=A0A6A6MTK0_HEVBR|nr:hypothetical protein GH714_012231 [Hevea brasiliensis]
MMSRFEMTDLGLLHYFLGLEVKQSEDGLEDGTEQANSRSFRSLVRGLIYLAHTRLDISFSIGVVSRFMSNPSKHHFGAAKRILCYIAGTLDYGICYSHVSDFKLYGYTDSDWASSLDDRKSTSGHVFSLGSGVITWSSKKQATPTLSSSEAEYVVVTSSASQCIWLQRMLADLHQKHQKQENATEIFCDNKSTIAMTKNPAFHGRMKHIDIHFHFIRKLVAKGEIILKFCNTDD